MLAPEHQRFGPFRLDLDDASIWREGERLHLNPKAFAVLACLLERAPRLVTKRELLDRVWPDTSVVEAVLTTAVREIRRALDDRARDPVWLQTVHGRGYRFIGRTEARANRRSMAGREAERGCLRMGWDAAREGARRVVFVAGEAGIGKTTLVEDFIEAVAVREGARIGRGQCVEGHGAAEPYLPLLEALSRLGQDDAAVGAALIRHAPSWLAHLPALNAGRADRRGATSPAMVRELAEGLEVLGADRPLVLLLEDLHWSDDSTVRFLAYLARRQDRARLLVIATYRPVDAIVLASSVRSLVAELRAHPQAQEIVVDNLSASEVQEVLQDRALSGIEPGTLAPVLHRRTRGHPLYLVTLLDALERGTLRTEDVEEQVPDGVRMYIEGRLDRLADDEQRVLEAASLAGPCPSVSAIAAALQRSEAEVEDVVSGWLGRGELVEDAGVLRWADGTIAQQVRFRHALFQEVLTRRIPPGRRARWSRRIGQRLERAYGETGRGRAAGELAAYFEAGGDLERAAMYLARAAAVARIRSAYPEAKALVDRGRRILEIIPPSAARDRVELDLLLEQGALAMVTEGWAAERVERAFSRSLVLARSIDDPTLAQRALFGALGYRLVRGDFEVHQRLSDEMRRATERTADVPGTVVAQIELGGSAYARGELAPAEVWFERGLAGYAAADHLVHVARFGADFGVFGQAWRSHLAVHRGEADAARARCAGALELAHRLDHPTSLAIAEAYAAILHQLLDEPEPALAHAEATLRLSARYGLRYYEAWAQLVAGWARVIGQGEPAGRITLRAGLQALEAAGVRRMLPHFWGTDTRVAEKLGAYAEAEASLDRAFAVLASTGERAWRPELLRLRAQLNQRRDPKAARRAWAEAETEAAAQGASWSVLSRG